MSPAIIPAFLTLYVFVVGCLLLAGVLGLVVFVIQVCLTAFRRLPGLTRDARQRPVLSRLGMEQARTL